MTLHHGDCLDVLRALPDASVDAVVTDPPYGLGNTTPAQVADTVIRWVNGERDYLPGGAGFMGKAWDAFVPPVAVWDECLRVLKPGGHVLAFAGSRTHDLMTLGLRLAGFDIRDSFAWLYGSGFPKSLDVSKAIDKGTGANRLRQLECTAWMKSTGITAAQINAATSSFMGSHYLTDRMQAAIPTADMFDLLRPLLPEVPEAIERLVAERTGIEWTDYVNRPVLRQVKRTGKEPGTYGAFVGDNIETAAATTQSAHWQGWGTALKPAYEPIVMARKPIAGTVAANVLAHGTGALNIDGCRVGGGVLRPARKATGRTGEVFGSGLEGSRAIEDTTAGRWPANVVLDESQAEVLDEQSGEGQSRIGKPRGADSGDGWGMTATGAECDDQGGASRFFYVAKADASERVRVDGVAHPTVKPISVMRWLVRLVTPEGGTVLEPFAGSGTTAEACILEGFKCIAIEREADYLPLIKQRIHRRRDPVAAVRGTGDDGGLFDLLGGDVA
ncbi:DNA methyltransferase [Nocardioides kribbensis]|uniref:Methyltransferase n=1 Tax=Nocardioides kribbensis TaxID=305517 RepID=A0ABV1NZ01_9ACTN